jgi:hypothetical protein
MRWLPTVAAALALLAAISLVAAGPAGAQARYDGRILEIGAPSDQRLVTGGAVALRFRAQAGTRHVRAYVDRRNVTRRLARRGNRFSAQLSLRGLRPGPHRLLVTARRGGRRDADAVTVFVGRRVRSLVGVRARLRATSAVPVHVRVPRRARLVRVTLNGRDASAGLWPLLGARRSGDLSAAQGLRFGRNVLRVLALRMDGRYDVERRVIRVRRRAPLASAGHNRQAKVGRRVRLDARRSRAARSGRRLAYSWKLARAPKGSRTKLRRRASARPALEPDRAGTYVLRLTVREAGRRRAEASAVGSVDTVVVQATPNLPAIGWAIDTIADQNGSAVIAYGPNAAPIESPTALQMLALDSQTLANVTPSNDTFDLSLSSGVDELAAALTELDGNPPPLVVLAGGSSMTSSTLPAVNQALASIGVPPLPPGSEGPFSAIGVLGAAAGSMFLNPAGALNGYINQSFTPTTPPQQGQALPPPILGYTFSYGSYQPFQLSSTSTSATIALGATKLSYTNSCNGGGVAAVVVDAQNLQPVGGTQPAGGDVYCVNGSVPEQQRLANVLSSWAGNPFTMVALQTMGTIAGPVPANVGSSSAWSQLSFALGQYGATEFLWNTVNGGYSLVGGPGFSGPAAETSMPQSGLPSAQLQGMLGLTNALSIYEPILHDPLAPGQGFNYDFLTIAYQGPQSWPGEGQANWDAAYDWVSQQLDYPDVRSAYTSQSAATWGDAYTKLTDQIYDDCPTNDPTFSQTVCQQQVNEIANETLWVQAVTNYFDLVQEPLLATGSWSSADLNAIVGNVEQSVAPPNSQVKGDVMWLIAEGLDLLSYITGDEAEPVFGVFGAVTAGAATLATGSDGSAVLRTLNYDVSQLGLQLETDYLTTLLAYDQLEGIILSDYGKLSTMGKSIGGPGIGPPAPGWNWTDSDPDVTAGVTDGLTAAATRWSYGKLMPVAWDQWLVPNQNYDGTPVTPLDPWHWICNYNDGPADYPFNKLNSLSWFLSYEATGSPPAVGPQMWMIGKNTSSTFNQGAEFDYPPVSLVGAMNESFDNNLLLQAQFWAREFGPWVPISKANEFYAGCSD